MVEYHGTSVYQNIPFIVKGVAVVYAEERKTMKQRERWLMNHGQDEEYVPMSYEQKEYIDHQTWNIGMFFLHSHSVVIIH